MTSIYTEIVKPLSHLFDPIPCLFCAFHSTDPVEMEVHIETLHPKWEAHLCAGREKRQRYAISSTR